ncbi:hypothetical protein K2P56_00490 [Patescibacteria group bacterium]|nr:hypothetical protein [Patescibacteria group bacterium]
MSKELLRLANGAKIFEYHAELSSEEIVLHLHFDQAVAPEDLVVPALVEPIQNMFRKAMTDAGWASEETTALTFTLTADAFDDFKRWKLTATLTEK